jgi:predicted Zn-dependent protease
MTGFGSRAGRRRFLWAALCVALAVTGCQTVQTTRGGTVGVDRKQQMSVLTPSAAQVDQAARQQYQEVLGAARQKGRLNVDAGQTERVRAIAQRLIPHTAVFRDDAPRWAWEVNVLASDQVNAWCMPGGKIAVYSGLIDKLKVTDDELAAVIGHEIAHALREHARERMGRQQATDAGAAVVGLGIEIFTGVRLGGATSSLGQAVFVLPNSRENEQEADRIGVELAARAGYDPRAAITLWEKMGRASGGGASPQWLSTHPSHQTRIADLRDYSNRVLPLYEKTRKR